MIDNQRDWINRHSVYTHGNGFIASPANTVRGIANDPNQNGGYPDFLASVVGANGSVVSPGPAPLDQPRIYFGPVISDTAEDYAIVGENGAPREYDYETNTETKNYTYQGSGGVSGRQLVHPQRVRSEVRRAELPVLQRDWGEQQDPVQPRSRAAGRGRRAVAHPDTNVYPAIVNKRMVWILDGYTTLDNYPYSELTSLSSATADSNEVALNRLAPDKKVSYIRNSVKATVDAYDGTVTLYAQDEQDPVLKAWMSVFPGTVKPKSDISPDLAQHLRYPEDLFKVQRMLLAKYHVNDPVTFFSTSDFWDVPQDPNPSASSYQPPYYIVARDLAANDKSASFQLTTAMNRFRRDFLAAYISASSDPDTYGKITVLTIPGQVNGPKLANNAISTDTAVSTYLGQIGRDNQNRIQFGNLLTLPIGDGGLLYVEPVYASPGRGDAASTYPASDPGRDARTATRSRFEPTVAGALSSLFGAGAGSTATSLAPVDGGGHRRPPCRRREGLSRPRFRRPDSRGRRPRCPHPSRSCRRPGVPRSFRPPKPLRCKTSRRR